MGGCRTLDETKIGNRDSSYYYGNSITLDSTNKWSKTIDHLPFYNEQGQRWYYYAVETAINGIPLNVKADGSASVVVNGIEYQLYSWYDTPNETSYRTSLVNVAYSDITGTKSWKDNSDAYGTRPDGITLALYRKAGTGAEEVVNGADGKPLQPTWVKSGNTWTYTYTHLPEADDQGEAYTYRVEEIQTTGPAGGDQYTATQNGMNLTNTLTGTVNLQVEKLWQDNDNALGLRPDEIIVELCVNGSPGTPQ